jgi:hypothetical protein
LNLKILLSFNSNGTGVIAMQKHMMINKTKISEGGHHLKQLQIIDSGNNILKLRDRLYYTRLFVRRPRNQKSPKTDKS